MIKEFITFTAKWLEQLIDTYLSTNICSYVNFYIFLLQTRFEPWAQLLTHCTKYKLCFWCIHRQFHVTRISEFSHWIHVNFTLSFTWNSHVALFTWISCETQMVMRCKKLSMYVQKFKAPLNRSNKWKPGSSLVRKLFYPLLY